MKKSFYFVLFFLIYPILGLLNNSFINGHSFIIVLAIVFAISWLLNRLMPAALTYEKAMQITPILEDVYSGNVNSFKKRLSTDTGIEVISAVFLTLATIVIVLAIFIATVNCWISFVVFGFLTIGAVSRSAKLIKAKSQLSTVPTAGQCMQIVCKTYGLDYASYCQARSNGSFSGMLPAAPRCFKTFRVISHVFAAAAAVLGMLCVVHGILFLAYLSSAREGAVAGLLMLYGSLGVYFAFNDFIAGLGGRACRV